MEQSRPRFTDARLGTLNDAMYRYAAAKAMILKPRYMSDAAVAVWNFTWDAHGVNRKIQLTIREAPKFTDLHLSIIAWRDDPTTDERYVSLHPRSYTLRLPMSDELCLETLEMARRDAESLDVSAPQRETDSF